MIIKGSSRGGASQLGPYLLNAEKNERVKLLELKSPLDDLTGSLEDWQTLAEGTKQGKKGLYHAQIAPHGRYEMTPEQWTRSVDLLEQELGLTNQPRAVVLHNKDGKDHLHVVWQRTDLDTMKFIPDSFNYDAHERVSQQLEKEFGHEPVPGKHAKRERKPVDEETRNRDQQMKETINRLYQQSDTAQAFRSALEGEGYILAKGDRRPHIVIDDTGKEHSLTRCLPDLTAKEIREFMACIDRKTLPSAEEAKQLQREAAQRPPEPQQEKAQEEKPQQEKPAEKPYSPEPPKPDPHAEELAKLQSDLKARQDEETSRLLKHQQAERDRMTEDLMRRTAESLFEFEAVQRAQLEDYDRAQTPQRGRFATVIAAVSAWFNPEKTQDEIDRRQAARALFVRNQEKERERKLDFLNGSNQEEARNLSDRHARGKEKHNDRYKDELARYTREYEEAARLRAEIEDRRRQQEAHQHQQKPPPDSSL